MWNLLNLNDFSPELLSMSLAIPIVPPSKFEDAARAIQLAAETAAEANANAQIFGKYVLNTWLPNARVCSMYAVQTGTNDEIEVFIKKISK